ncbi:MAG TPA: CBS domain-containing protein, partial [Candidatus Methylomirabilis sp.]|nr:CBS domain-containing protein [Candidatus Methylomirabilis sp.]
MQPDPSPETGIPQGLTQVEALAYELHVKDVMTRPVVSVGPSDDIGHLSALLRAHNITGVPVVLEEKLVG